MNDVAHPRSTSRPTTIGFLPLLRDGDLLFTAFVLQSRMLLRASRVQVAAAVRGRRDLSFNALGPNPTEVGRRVFGVAGQDVETLTRHTLFGVYSWAMIPASCENWVRYLRDPRENHTLRLVGLPARRFVEVCSRDLRSCPACVTEDNETRGFAAWRVLHQVPALDRCPVHGDALIHELAPSRNGAGRGCLWPFLFPTGVRTGQSPEHIPLSEGYAAYLKLWPRLFRGEMTEVRADRWPELIKEIVIKLGGLDAARAALEDWIKRSWAMSLESMAKHLVMAEGSAFVAAELSLRSRPKDIARRLIILSAAAHLGLVRQGGDQFEIDYKADDPTRQSKVVNTPEARLRVKVGSSGLPIALSNALLQGETTRRAAKTAGAGVEALRLFLHNLPLHLLTELAVSGDWRSDSWLIRELRRRRY